MKLPLGSDALNWKLEDDQIVALMAAVLYGTNPNMPTASAVRHSFSILDEIAKQKTDREITERKERLKHDTSPGA